MKYLNTSKEKTILILDLCFRLTTHTKAHPLSWVGGEGKRWPASLLPPYSPTIKDWLVRIDPFIGKIPFINASFIRRIMNRLKAQSPKVKIVVSPPKADSAIAGVLLFRFNRHGGEFDKFDYSGCSHRFNHSCIKGIKVNTRKQTSKTQKTNLFLQFSTGLSVWLLNSPKLLRLNWFWILVPTTQRYFNLTNFGFTPTLWSKAIIMKQGRSRGHWSEPFRSRYCKNCGNRGSLHFARLRENKSHCNAFKK